MIRRVPLPPARTAAPRGRAALAGAAAAALALGTGELLAGLVRGAPSPLVAIGDLLIELQPPGAKQVVVALFGLNDKLALAVATAAVVLALGAGIGLLRRRHPDPALWAILALAGAGAIAGLRSPATSLFLAAASWAIQSIVGIAALDWLLDMAGTQARSADAAHSTTADAAEDPRRLAGADAGRRRFLATTGALGTLALAGGLLGRRLVDDRAARVDEVGVAIPDPVDPAPGLGPDPSTEIEGLTPFIVPTADFYRIDTSLVTPSIDLATWQLRVYGMVDREVTLTFAQLLELPLIERHVTIACVSNEVGGGLVGNATWTGVRLTDVLEIAGVQPGATQIVGHSVDGFTAGFPTSWVTERERDSMIAVAMNGAPLTTEHGYPVRLVVPGLYGYVSATKWLGEIELTTLEGFDGYWIPRGWAKEAPILTQSRIDVPRQGKGTPAGRIAIAGVAWAPDRGVTAVEVSIERGPWQPATIVNESGPASWVQWKLAWDATPGTYEISVRATDGRGEVQTDQPTRPDPDGARGHHTIVVTIT